MPNTIPKEHAAFLKNLIKDNEWMDWVSRERVNNLTNGTLVRRAFIDAQVNNLKSTVLQTQPTCTRYCLGSSSASLVSGYEFLLGLILGSEYDYISMVKRDG